MDDPELVQLLERQRPHDTIEGRLRARMQADALQPLTNLEEEGDVAEPKANLSKTPYSEEDIKEAAQFLRLSVSRAAFCTPLSKLKLRTGSRSSGAGPRLPEEEVRVLFLVRDSV